MGSHQDLAKCPNCNGVLFTDFYYHSGEEYNSCHRCGFYESYTLKRDEDRKAMKDEKGEWIWIHNKHEGHGIYGLFDKNSGVGQVGTFGEPISEETIEEFRNIFKKEDIDVERSYLAKWEDGKQTLLLGNALGEMNTMDFDELTKKWENEAEEANRVPIEELDGYSRDEFAKIIQNYLEDRINYVEDDFKITTIGIVGSRLKGTHGEDSDLDIAFQYEGRYRSDSMCDTLNMEPLEIEGIRIDFVPYASYKGEAIDKGEPIEYLPVRLGVGENDIIPF